MKYAETTEYTYHYCWVLYEGKICIAEVYWNDGKEFFKFPGSIMVAIRENLTVLKDIEDYTFGESK